MGKRGISSETHAACDSARPLWLTISGTSDGRLARTVLVARIHEPNMLYSVIGTVSCATIVLYGWYTHTQGVGASLRC